MAGWPDCPEFQRLEKQHETLEYCISIVPYCAYCGYNYSEAAFTEKNSAHLSISQGNSV